jgi:hypothetical protein
LNGFGICKFYSTADKLNHQLFSERSFINK